ncbi:jg25523 [Pararge aegeria aegeria]|uniref:Jg25523 protein n=3 Tax=Pararge aegeria TaxID=116150 RepID=A0A8S4RUT2_9NEOP|nr:jg25523 [Pararge aegeria aegeria]
MNWCVIFVCLCIVSVRASGNSLKDPYICGHPTCAPSEKFRYLTPIIYHYEYKTKVETYFAGSSNNRSTLDVKARVTLQFIKPCEGLLQLSDVTLIDQDENYPVERAEKFIHAIGLFDLRFAFHDGIISEICPEEAEEDWVLNYKRAILSLFQNSMKRFDINFKGVEQDIHGTCNVDYIVRGQENTSLVLVKTRDLSQCTDRYKYMSILQTVRYDFQSKFQTWPVLKSESKCVISVDHHIYKSVNCRERHLFEPFSGRNSGGMTTVIQDLTLVEEVNKTGSDSMDSENKDDEISTVDENMDSGSIVGLWGRLVRSARKLHHPALAQLLARAPTICPTASKHILDALPYIASPGSVELIKNMILNNEADKDTRHEWLMSMAMIPRPKLDMLKSMLELLQQQKNDKVVSFTVSSMTHSYCKHNGKSLRECCEEEVPKQILEEFQNVVNEVISKVVVNPQRQDRDNLVIAIKALGNIGGFKQEFADVLMNIIGDTLISVPIRLTAIDAFRRTPCVETREYFLETYREDLVDVEIRIASYLQVMRCPNLSTIRKIFHALRNEPVNQVATFVWSHLNNLGHSSLPSRVEIQGLLSGNTMPQLEDNPDFRMFSRNYEQSVFFDQYNAGGNYEANVIFSPDSYIPRALSLNLTIDMFGESINLLEIKARGEGFEKYFEGLFGNQGVLSKNKVNDRINKLRFFRSTNEADEVRDKVDDLGYKNNALKHRFPMAELGFKVFGNEISFWSAEGDEEIRKSLERLNPKLRVLEILSGKEISYNKASLFLDTTFSVPTGSGMPLNLNLMGTSYVDTKMSGTVSDKYARSGNLDFEGKIRPSVAVNIAATMSVSAGSLASSGIRLSSRLYTATSLAAKLSLRGLDEIKLDLSLPRDKQEIFAAKSELLILHGDEELPQQGINKNRIEQNTCSWTTFDKAIGIKVCAAYQFPNMTNLRDAPYFLLSGPAKYIVSLEKADPSAKTYALRYKWDRNETTNLIDFSFDTPNSKEKRMFNARLLLSNSSSTASLTLHTSESVIKANALYRNIPYDKCISASLDVDGKKQFDTVMSLKRHDVKYGFVWLPHAYWVVNDEKIAELSGSLKVKSKGGVTQWDIAADFQTKQLASRMIGYYTVNGPTHGTKLNLDYQFYGNPKQNIKIEGLYSERPMSYRHDLYGELSMEFTAYPMYNFYSILRNVKTQNHIDIGFNVSTSKAERSDPAFTFVFKRIDKLNGLKLDTQVVLKRPKPIILKFQYDQTGPKYSALALLNFNPKSREILISGYVFAPPGTQLYADAELNVTLPTLHPCQLKAKLHEKQPNEFQVNAMGVWFTGVDFNIDAVYQDQSKTNLASYRLKVLINSSHFKDIAVDARFTQDNRQITFIAEGEYNADKYKALVRYLLLSEQNFTAYGEIGISEKSYSLSLNADLNNNTNIDMDIHFDQLRDVHISYQRAVSARQKRLSASFNWDANRDPSQKLSIDAKLDHKGDWHHGGHVTLHYPGRVVNGEFEFLLKDWFCEWMVQMGWASQTAIVWRVKAFSEVHDQTIYALLSSLSTPFPMWEDTSFNLMWRYKDNLQAVNGSMNWQENFLAFNLLADYLFTTTKFYGEINASVNSTIPTLPRAAAIARHTVVWKKSADTLLSFQYNEDGLLMINSSWAIHKGLKENNVTGRVTLLTPFQGYTKGFLRTEFVFGHKRDIKGVTYLDLEEKVIKIYVNGHMRRITNCMLVVNVTSPIPQFSHTTARFGFVEADRHLVAMIVTPNTTTGIEVLLKLLSLQDFQIFGHVALPLQYLNRAMITAKRAAEEVDFRVGWGSMDFGFTGIWQWKSILDFVYVYKLYTPLEDFEENGLVMKNIYKNGLDTELSIRLSKHKFGIAILLVDNGKGLLDVIKDRFQHKPGSPDMFVENFDTEASVILDTLYYPTITFHSHMMKFVGPDEQDILEANATLHLPDKAPIVLTDVFILESYTVMQNTLNLVTPFQAIQQLKSVYTLDIAIGEKINLTCVALLYNGTYWHELDDPFVETSGSLNLTSAYLEDYFIKMEFKKDFSDVENVVGGGIQIQQGNQNNYIFADAVWRPPPSRHIRFKARGALVPVLSPAELAFLFSEENNQRTLTVDFNTENDYYSLKADQWPASLSVALSSPHKHFRAMKIIGEFEGDDIRGTFVKEDTEYSITGKVLNRDPLELSLNIIPKGQGQQLTIRVKCETTPTVYAITAHIVSSIEFTVRAKLEMEQNFTDVYFKMLTIGENFDANATITWTANSKYSDVDNIVSYKWDVNGSKYIDYTLNTPWYEKEPTLTLKGSYQKDMVHKFQVVKGRMHRPGSCQIGEIDVRYGGFKHTDGHFNVSTPFHTLPWLKSIFDINNADETSDNRVDLFWPNKTAAINTSHIYTKHDKGFTQNGTIALSIPVNTQHLINSEYFYLEEEKFSNGNAVIDFDKERFVKVMFDKILSKSERNLDVATMNIQVENVHTPVGIKYIQEYDETGSIDVKQATLFHLHNTSILNVTGILDVHSYDIGKKMKFTAIHGSRTWNFDNIYEVIDKQLKQGSKITWAEDVWLGYDIHVTNLTVADTESQQITMDVRYPRRIFRVTALYRLQDTLLDGTAHLLWNVRDENKTAELRGKWENPPYGEGNLHDVYLALSHPSFRKDVTLQGKYLTTPSVMLNLSMELQYSDYEHEYLKLKSVLTDNSNGPVRDYKFALKCVHPSTNLDLDMKSDIHIHSRWYYLSNYYRFQKSLFYEKLRSTKFLVDLNKDLINWERVNETYFYKVNGTWNLVYPRYQLKGIVLRPNANDTMFAELSMLDKAIGAHYNSTDDISYHMIGKIIDTRSARLDAWRHYDDVTTVDLASYIRLNHSRLLTSAFMWRPEIFSEIKSSVVYTLKILYNQVNETLLIVKEAPMEAHLALRNIWSDAKPRVREFLDDLNDLHVIKDDLDDFELFLNESYDHNDFYVKNIVEFTYYVLDEMAIRNHLEGLPGFVNDMWGMMGNTSQSIKQSLTFVVDSIKNAYSNFLESMNKVLEADLMEMVSDKLESMILQYDNFVRDLHMKFLEYWEETWVNASSKFSKYWHDLLKSIEPLFFKMLHYTEAFVVTIWRGIMDFFHERTHELTDTPYFNYVSTFGHEMDRIYKDLVNNDIITNIKKYTKKLWYVIWNKVEKYIPFTEEFKQLYNEFRNAWENFLKTPQVVYVREKYKEAYVRLKWWYDYFLIGEAFNNAWEIVYAKVTSMAKTALQYEELHRTPKTNFIFDPYKGEILLEQKLPMSWHAFNQTPDFSEISEYKTVRDFMDEWLISNRSIWAYYYDMRPYLDFNNVVPPFAGLGIMTGQGTLVTFDKQVFTISEPGTFLLTKDYRQNNFTVLMESNDQGKYDLVVLTKKNLIFIDLYKEQVSLGRETPLNLPAVVDELVVDRQTDTLSVQSQNGLQIDCNLLFRTCKLEVTGWYYASLGGLLGTYNNEQFDEQQLPNGTIDTDAKNLAHAWSIRSVEVKTPPPRTNNTSCAKFFRNKVSPLHPCFSLIDAMPFYEECEKGVEACTLANAYLELCSQQHVPTHIPDHCVQCITPGGDLVEEGAFLQLENLPESMDVVFVVEAQYCNKNIRKAKNIDLFVDTLDSKLQGNGFSDNRYAVVVYGGSGVYRRARALYVNNKLFTDAVDIPRHFEAFQIDKNSLVKNNKTVGGDALRALSFVSSLPLRAGAPRAIVLLPCTKCDASFSSLDYSTIYHNLMENSITLHILMDGDFSLSKKRVAKYLFGVDNYLAYTNKDYERLIGDAGLRKQVRLPKDKLGLCTSLSLETNGTIWAGSKLEGDRGAARRFATVAGGRIAGSSTTCQSQRCECRNAALHCRPCANHDPLELSFWNTDNIDDLIDMAMDPPNLPSFS